METPFIGGAYLGRSRNLNAQVCQNLYPIVDQHGGKSVLGLYGIPGITSWINLGGVRSSGSLRFNGELTYENVWTPPNLDALWAWFKHDEGSGTTIIDYSPVDTDGLLTAINDPLAIDYFWDTLPGFGTSGMGAHAEYQAYVGRTAPSRNSAYCSLVAFIKPLGDGQFNAYQAVQLGHTGLLNSLDVGWEGVVTLPPTPHYWRLGANGQSAFSTEVAVYGNWYCVYAYSQAGVNNNGLYIRKIGDADWTLAKQNIGVAAGAGTDQTSVFAFGISTDAAQVSGGDCLYYANPTSDGMITLAQATDIYENLMGRY